MPSPFKNEVTHPQATKLGRTQGFHTYPALPPRARTNQPQNPHPILSAYPWPVPEKKKWVTEYRTDMSGLVTQHGPPFGPVSKQLSNLI